MTARACLSFVLCLAMAKVAVGAEQGPARPRELSCHCQFVKLSAQAAAEFFAAADLATPRPRQKGPPELAVCRNAGAALLKLKKAGRATISDWPSVVATSEKPATLLAGGEFPLLIPTGGDRVDVQWKRFGQRSEVTPRWLDTGKLELEIAPEIATKDLKHAVTTPNGLTIPALTTRRCHVRVEMNPGETAVVNLGANPEDEATITLFMVTPRAGEESRSSRGVIEDHRARECIRC